MIVGLDVGGTNIDATLIDKGEIIAAVKNPADNNNLFESIWQTLQDLLNTKEHINISRINLSTTVSTNAIIEGKTVPVGMIIQSGPGINSDFLACGQDNAFIKGYIDHRGREVKTIDKNEINDVIQRFKRKGIEAVAIVTKFSVRNPIHEIQIKNILENDFYYITMGHTLSGKLNFPRRVYTSYLNTAVSKTFKYFSDSISKALEIQKINAPIYVLKADGGTMSLKTGEKTPINTVLSGPAASLMGACALMPTCDDTILLDIGGTTTDISFLVDGVPAFEPLGIKIGEFKTLIRAIYSVPLGVGGDSRINVHNNDVYIGPERSGPPMALGGKNPTPSDAMIALGLMNFGNKDKANLAMKEIGQLLGVTPNSAAKKVLNKIAYIIHEKVKELLEKINSQPVYTVRELLYGRKVEPQKILIIGGPAKSLAPILQKEFDLPCYVPKNYKIANAIGAALARTTAEITLLADTENEVMSVPEINLIRKIDKNYNIEMAKEEAISLLMKTAIEYGAENFEIEPEIIEAASYNMVRGFQTVGKNIRIKAQVKPGLLYNLRGVGNGHSQ